MHLRLLIRAYAYACMEICVYLWIVVYVNACLYVCLYVRVYVCMYVCMYACKYVHVYACINECIHVYLYAWMYICIHACHSREHSHTHTHAHTHTCRLEQGHSLDHVEFCKTRKVPHTRPEKEGELSMYVMFITCVSRPEWNQTTHICLQSCCVHVHRQTDRQTTDRPSRDAPVEFGARKSRLDRHVRRACFPRVPPPTWQNTSECQTYPWCMNSMTTTNSCALCALDQNVWKIMYEWRELTVESCTVLTEYLRLVCGVACAVAYQIYLGGDFHCAYKCVCVCVISRVIARASACATVCVRVCVCARVCVCIHSYQLHSTGGKESRCWGKRRHRAFPLLRHIFSRNTRYCIGLVCSTEKFILRVCVRAEACQHLTSHLYV